MLRGNARGVVWQSGPLGLFVLPALYRPDECRRADVAPTDAADVTLFGTLCRIRVGWGSWRRGPLAALGTVSAPLLADLEAAWRREVEAAGYEHKWRKAALHERAVRM